MENNEYVYEKIKNISDLMPCCVYWIDNNHFYLGSNNLFAQTLGLGSYLDLVGKNNRELFPEKTLDTSWNIIDKNNPYQVVGIASDYLNAKLATSYISQANLASDFDQTTDLLIMVEAKDGVDLAGVEADLQQIVAKYPAFTLFASADCRETQQQTLNGSLGIMYFLMTALAGTIAHFVGEHFSN